jgi:hypothetical protein
MCAPSRRNFITPPVADVAATIADLFRQQKRVEKIAELVGCDHAADFEQTDYGNWNGGRLRLGTRGEIASNLER